MLKSFGIFFHLPIRSNKNNFMFISIKFVGVLFVLIMGELTLFGGNLVDLENKSKVTMFCLRCSLSIINSIISKIKPG